MYFQLSEEAEKWFKDIAVHYPLKFDLYYLCLMVGFAYRRKNPNINSNSVANLVENFPGEFRTRGKLLVGLLIDTELRNLCIDYEDRDTVYKEISKIVEPGSPSFMSSDGVRRMNEYAHGGFDVLCEYFEERPRSIETFVRKYFLCLTRNQTEN